MIGVDVIEIIICIAFGWALGMIQATIILGKE